MRLQTILAAGLLVSAAFGGSGCGTLPAPSLRLDPPSYVYEGYLVDTKKGVSLVVEDLRFSVVAKGSVIVDLAVIYHGPRTIRFDTGQCEVQVLERSLLAREERAITIQPGRVERLTLSFRTDLGPEEIERGVLQIGGFVLDSGEELTFTASFHRASETELARERGESAED